MLRRLLNGSSPLVRRVLPRPVDELPAAIDEIIKARVAV